jgi:hypothetical protein
MFPLERFKVNERANFTLLKKECVGACNHDREYSLVMKMIPTISDDKKADMVQLGKNTHIQEQLVHMP